MRQCTIVFLCVFSLFGISSSLRVLSGEVADVDPPPTIELRLAPPVNPQPQVAAEVNLLERARKELEGSSRQELQEAFEKAFADAKRRIDALLQNVLVIPSRRSGTARASDAELGFLEENTSSQHRFSLKVNLFAPPPVDAAVQGRIEQVEKNLALAEQRMFEQACGEMQRITDIVLHVLGARLHPRAGTADGRDGMGERDSAFLELPPQANVRVSPSENAFPTIRSLVENLERRLQKSESQEMTHILELEMRLFTSETSYIKHAMEEIIKRKAPLDR